MTGATSTWQRDQDVTAFGPILMRLCRITCARAVALVDSGGETVDYASCLGPDDTRVIAAEWQLVLALAKGRLAVFHRSAPARGPERSASQAADATDLLLSVRGRDGSFAIQSLPEGYAIVLALPRGCLDVSARALSEAVHDICAEACLHQENSPPHWTTIEVETEKTDRERPVRIWRQGKWDEVDVLGSYTPDPRRPRVRGFRVRAATGDELNLVREPLDRWFAA